MENRFATKVSLAIFADQDAHCSFHRADCGTASHLKEPTRRGTAKM